MFGADFSLVSHLEETEQLVEASSAVKLVIFKKGPYARWFQSLGFDILR